MIQRPHPYGPSLIAMAGLPGTGKSTVAAELAKLIHGRILDKDQIRAALFSKQDITYSREQDDLCMKIIFLLAEYLLAAAPGQPIIIDGRTFSRTYQVEQLVSHAKAMNVKPIIIECKCDDAAAAQRLQQDQRNGSHPAGNRNYDLYVSLKDEAEPIMVEHLVIDTGSESVGNSVERALSYLRRFAPFTGQP